MPRALRDEAQDDQAKLAVADEAPEGKTAAAAAHTTVAEVPETAVPPAMLPTGEVMFVTAVMAGIMVHLCLQRYRKIYLA